MKIPEAFSGLKPLIAAKIVDRASLCSVSVQVSNNSHSGMAVRRQIPHKTIQLNEIRGLINILWYCKHIYSVVRLQYKDKHVSSFVSTHDNSRNFESLPVYKPKQRRGRFNPRTVDSYLDSFCGRQLKSVLHKSTLFFFFMMDTALTLTSQISEWNYLKLLQSSLCQLNICISF